jgi:hypothetical protein
MEIMPLITLEIDGTVTSEPSNFPVWDTNTKYYPGDRVYNSPSIGGDNLNYECTAYANLAKDRPDLEPDHWVVVGGTSVEISSPVTSADESLATAWVSGESVDEGVVKYDEIARRDYVAALDISDTDNIIRPSVAVQSDDVDLAARWVDYRPANAWACLDAEISTKTRALNSMSMTLLGSGEANRIALFGLENATDVQVVVNSSNIIADEEFASSSLTTWEGTEATLTHLDPGMRVTNTNTGTTGGATQLVTELTPGVSYTFTAVVSAATGGSGTWRLSQYNALGGGVTYSSSANGAGTRSLTFTATGVGHHIVVELYAGTSTVDLQSVDLRQTGFTQEVVSVDLEYGATGRYKRRAILSHSAVSRPKYDIVITGLSGATVGVGAIVAGLAEYVAATETGVRAGGRGFHDIREDRWGNTRYQKGTRKRELTANAFIDEADADYVDAIMSRIDGTPAVFDMNNPGTDIERLLVLGFASDWYTTVTGIDGLDLLVISPLRGLAE